MVEKVSSLYLQNNLKTILLYIAYSSFFTPLQCERCAAERKKSVSVFDAEGG